LNLLFRDLSAGNKEKRIKKVFEIFPWLVSTAAIFFFLFVKNCIDKEKGIVIDKHIFIM